MRILDLRRSRVHSRWLLRFIGIALLYRLGSTQELAQSPQPLLPAHLWGHFDSRTESMRHSKGSSLNRATSESVFRQDSLHSYDALRYDLSLELDMGQRHIAGQQRMLLVARESGLEELVLHLAGLGVDSLLRDGEPTTWQHIDDRLLVNLAGSPLFEGDSTRLAIHFSGTPSTPEGVGLFFQGDRAWTLSDPWGTRFWAPCFDEPHDKAQWSLNVRCPDDLQVMANGTLTETVPHDDGTIEFRYRHDVPMSSYLASLVAGPAIVLEDDWNGLPLRWMVYPSHEDEALLACSRVGAMFDCFTALWGDYPFESYAMGEAPIYGGMGGMEHQTCTTIGNGIIAAGLGYESIIAHELAHQWWGDAVTPVDFRNVWLNEGWATYAEAFYYRHLADDDELPFLDYVRELRNVYLNWDVEMQPIYAPPANDLFNVNQYEKAACVLHMLREMVGRANFDAAQRDWLNQHLFSTVDTEEYRQHLETATGFDLAWFFEQWIYTGGYPSWEVSTETIPFDGGWRVHLSVTQSHPTLPVFRSQVPLRLLAGAARLDTCVWIDNGSTQLDWLVDEPLDTLIFNADFRALGRARTVSTPGPLHLRLVDFLLDDGVGGNGDGDLASGEEARLGLRLVNDGGWDLGLHFLLESADLDVEGGWAPVDQLGWGEELWLETGPVLLSAAAGDTRWATLALQIDSESSGSTTTSFRLPIGDPRILLVNGDAGGRHAHYYRSELDSLLAFSDEVTPDQLSDPPAPGQDHDIVFWYTGDAGSALRHQDVAWLSEWAALGGAWLLSGQDALDSLSEADLQFIGLAPAPVSGPALTVVGSANGPLAGLDGLLIGTGGAANQSHPDLLVALDANWQVAARYPTPSVDAAFCRPATEFGGPALVVGFGLEAVSGMAGTSSRREWLDASLAWLLDDWTDLAERCEPRATRPGSPTLLGLAPNPFNPSCWLRYRLDGPGATRLRVYDLLGRLVLDQNLGQRSAGEHRQRIDLAGAASGPYILELESSSATVAAPLLLLR